MPEPIDFTDIDALTFDCYGTLIDWEAGLSDAFRPVLAAHAIDHDPEDVLTRYARARGSRRARPVPEHTPRCLRPACEAWEKELGFEPTADEMHTFSRSVEGLAGLRGLDRGVTSPATGDSGWAC
jgi:FMN phosphatase YigB (HAD superfamily)